MTVDNRNGQETQLHELKRQRLALTEEYHRIQKQGGGTIVDTLLTLPDDKIVVGLEVVKSTVSKSLPVTQEAKRHLGKHEIADGVRFRPDVEMAWAKLFEGLVENVIERAGVDRKINKDEAVSVYKQIDHRTMDGSVNFDHRMKRGDVEGGENYARYQKLISEITSLLIDIGAQDSDLAIRAMQNAVKNLLSTSHGVDSFLDDDLSARVKFYEDIFLEMIRDFKKIIPTQMVQTEKIDDYEQYLSGVVENMITATRRVENQFNDLMQQIRMVNGTKF